MTRLDAIFEWNMTVQEAEAYKLCLIWEEQIKKLFPNGRFARIPDKGDPRKCNLFKHCWKLHRLTRGLLKEDEYKLYVVANLHILKHHNARIEPNSLCGDKAWVRWRVWKRMYDKKALEVRGEEVPPSLSVSPKIVIELDRTKLFLFEKSEGAPTKEKTKAFLERSMKIWVSMGKVSYYYIVLSPWINELAKIEDLEQKYLFDASLYREKADEGVKAFFKKEFEYEFRQDT
jgi:hypothetical protein